MKFFRGLILTVLTFLKSLVFISAAVWSIGHIFKDNGLDQLDYDFLVKVFIASLALTFTMIGLCKNMISEEFADSRKFYKTNLVIHYGLVLAGTVVILISEFLSGWDGFGVFFIGVLIYALAVLELVLSFFIYNVYSLSAIRKKQVT